VSIKPAAAAAPVAGGPPQQQAAVTDFEGRQWAVVTGVIPSPQQAKEYRNTFANAPQPQHDSPRWKKFEVQRQEGEGPWTPLNLDAGDHQQVVPEPDPYEKTFAAIRELCHPAPKMIGKEHDKSILHPKVVQAAADLGDKPAARPGANQPLATPAAVRAPEAPTQFLTEQLFRCFDYSVQPGKSYRYKVRLVLENPNRDLQRYEVKDGEMLKGSTRYSPWSEPSPVVSIPEASSLLAGAIERPRNQSQEAKAEVVVRMWDPVRGVDALKFARLYRGYMANFNEDTPFPDNVNGNVVSELVNFKTNLALIDLAGGDSLPSYRGRSPGRLLLLSPSGELTVKSELSDIDTFDSELTRITDLHDAVEKHEEDQRKAEEAAKKAAEKAKPGDEGDKKDRRSRKKE
jgi:hypothetical protein